MLTRTFPRGILASLYLYIKAVLVLSPRQDGSPVSRVEDDPSPFGRDCLVLELGDTHTGRTLTPKEPCSERGSQLSSHRLLCSTLPPRQNAKMSACALEVCFHHYTTTPTLSVRVLCQIKEEGISRSV